MTLYSYILFVISSILIYMMTRDNNVADYILLIFKLINSLIYKASMFVQVHPLFTTNFLSKRRMMMDYELEAIEIRKQLGMD